MANRRGGRNKLVVPGVDNYIEKFKNEIAAELGIPNYDQLDKGALPARVHGMIGGTMTKRLIEMGQLALAGQNPNQSNLHLEDYVQHMKEDLQTAVDGAAPADRSPFTDTQGLQ